MRPAEIDERTRIDLYPHQRVENARTLDGKRLIDWYIWILEGGRGSGKTDGAAEYFDRFMMNNPGYRGAIIAPTLDDAVVACLDGPSGLKARNPAIRIQYGGKGGTHVFWPNGSLAKVFGAYTKEDVERLRAGGNRHIVWAEELAAWKQIETAWDNMEFGLRLGARPRVIVSTTPKARRFYMNLRRQPKTVITHGTIDDNPALDETTRARWKEKYAGTRLGRQELSGELIEEIEGALWTYKMLDALRVKEAPSNLVAKVVAIDPAISVGEKSAETGIIVAGRSINKEGYVLADLSDKLTPDQWAMRALRAFFDYECDYIVYEANQGGNMVRHALKTAAESDEFRGRGQAQGVVMRSGGDWIPFRPVHATKGKRARAEDISPFYEQGRAHHVGSFPALEDQLCGWDPADSEYSPDRMDALVWAFVALMFGIPTSKARDY